MTIWSDRRSARIVHVRVRSAGDVPTARRHAVATLAGMDLTAPSLPPSAILCLRSIRVTEPIGVTHDPVARRGFERALQTSVDDLARSAMRAADRPMDGCNAVVFDDLAQLLACLAQDWIDGRTGDRWWWRALLRAGATLDLVVNTWADNGPHIAPAFERLVATGGAAAFVAALETRHVRLLMGAMTRAHGGPPATALLAGADQAERTTVVNGRGGAASASVSVHALTSIARRDPVASSPSLGHEQRALAVFAAVIRDRPSLLQQTRFVDGFGEGLRAIAFHTRTPDRIAAVTDPAAYKTGMSTWPATRAAEHDDADTVSAAARLEQVPDGRRRDLSHSKMHRVDDRAAPGAMPVPLAAETVMAADESRAHNLASTHAGTLTSPSETPYLDTPLGGVFYLLNVVIALRLYGDFTTPQRRRLPLSPWDLLALVAEHWIDSPLDADLARVLARLAGRTPEQQPGEPPIRYDRLRQWVPHLVRRINRRVAVALGETADTPVAQRLLCHHARVHVTAAHVDVMFALESLPTDIRLAGLDRNPGWVPSAGRIVTFHYS